MNVVEKHFDKIAHSYDSGKKRYDYYYSNVKFLLSTLIPKGKKVLEIGCGTGDLLASLKPKYGFGVDISKEMIKIASKKYKNIKFSTKYPKQIFGYIFMTDVIEHLEDPKKEFTKIFNLMDKNSVFINTMANPIWEPLLMFWERLGLKMPEGPHSRLQFNIIQSMLLKIGFKVVKHNYYLLIPIQLPVITKFVNRFFEKYFKKYAFIEYFIAKKG